MLVVLVLLVAAFAWSEWRDVSRSSPTSTARTRLGRRLGCAPDGPAGIELLAADDDDASDQLDALAEGLGAERTGLTIKPPRGWHDYGWPRTPGFLMARIEGRLRSARRRRLTLRPYARDGASALAWARRDHLVAGKRTVATLRCSGAPRSSFTFRSRRHRVDAGAPAFSSLGCWDARPARTLVHVGAVAPTRYRRRKDGCLKLGRKTAPFIPRRARSRTRGRSGNKVATGATGNDRTATKCVPAETAV